MKPSELPLKPAKRTPRLSDSHVHSRAAVEDYDELLTGQRREGQFTMARELVPKICEIPADAIPFLLMSCLKNIRVWLSYALQPLHSQWTLVWFLEVIRRHSDTRMIRMCFLLWYPGCIPTTWGFLMYDASHPEHEQRRLFSVQSGSSSTEWRSEVDHSWIHIHYTRLGWFAWNCGIDFLQPSNQGAHTIPSFISQFQMLQLKSPLSCVKCQVLFLHFFSCFVSCRSSTKKSSRASGSIKKESQRGIHWRVC